MAPEIRVIGLEGIPVIKGGDDLAEIIAARVQRQGLSIEDKDILVVTQKIVSKAEGSIVRLDDVQPSEIAIQLSKGHNRDPRHTEIILKESVRIVRMDRGNIISETRHGFICANAGVDASNVPGDDTVALLPIDPDASAKRIRSGIRERLGTDVAVIISDTFGRPWREGAVNVAIGVAGIPPLGGLQGQGGRLWPHDEDYGYRCHRRNGGRRRVGHGQGQERAGGTHKGPNVRTGGCFGPA